MPRFVILYHETPPDYERPTHWDFMLEVEASEGVEANTGANTAVLRTWTLPEPPDSVAAQEAESLPDHRIEYLTLEGPLSHDRGSVTQWDSGTYEVEAGDIASAESSSLVVRLHGDKMNGRVELVREDAIAQRWRFCWSADESAA